MYAGPQSSDEDKKESPETPEKNAPDEDKKESPETPEEKIPDAPQKQAEITKQLDNIFKTKKDIFERFKKALQILRFNEYNKRAFLKYTLEDIGKDMKNPQIQELISALKTEELFSLPFQRSLVPQVGFLKMRRVLQL